MKKKVFIFTGLCALSLCCWEAQAFSPKQTHSKMYLDDNHIPTEAEKIVLRGRLDYNAGPDDIEAGATENAVYIYFGHNYGNVSISIFNAMGNRVYYTVMDTSVQQTVIIPFGNVASGNYTVTLDNADGYAEGDFERN